MTSMERQIRITQQRLWLNRLLQVGPWTSAACGFGFALLVLIQRLYDAPIPLFSTAMALAFAALLGAAVWTWWKSEEWLVAAVRLDEAAGLRERLSTAQLCLNSEDPFARAVVADAERVATTLSARQHVRLAVPGSTGVAVACVLFAASMFLVPPGVLKSEEKVAAEEQKAQTEQSQAAVKRKLDQLRDVVNATPALEDLADKLDPLDPKSAAGFQKPSDVRHDAIKSVDRLVDAVKQKREEGDYEAARELRKMLRAVKPPGSEESPTQMLAAALSQGDFDSAKEEIEKLRQQLGTLQEQGDKEKAENLARQLDKLAKQIEQAPKNEQMSQKLQQAGLSKEDAERILENLKKQDLEQVKKQLEEKGLSKEQVEKLAKQLQQKQNAGAMAQKLAQAMQQGAQSIESGQMEDASAGLSSAADQLSQLEQMEQEMAQLDAALAELEQGRNDIDKPCPTCGGTGEQGGRPCQSCGGSGNQPGQGGLGPDPRQGRGGLAKDEPTAVGFKIERGKVATTKGAIIGKTLVRGEQVKGDVKTEFVEVVTAAEHEASDRINRNRVPRQYQNAVKAYFSNVQKSIGGDKVPTSQPDKTNAPTEKVAPP